MTGQQWRTYALLLHLYATYTAATWLLDQFGDPWGYVATVFLLGWSLLGLIIPVTRSAKHRLDEAA